MQNKNKIISIEGGEGSGKTTVIKGIESHLLQNKINVMVTREPGGVLISEAIRNIILDCSYTQMDARTEALLFAAARRQHLVEKVYPAIERGEWVVFDRFVDSSLVYQGFVRGIGVDEVYAMNQFAIETFMPDLTFYLDIDPEVGLKRIHSDKERELNRLDKENLDFHQKVREGYHLLMEQFPKRIIKIDASQSPEDVLKSIVVHLNTI